jgi:uroporphyrinogen III methyltransferase/synthase
LAGGEYTGASLTGRTVVVARTAEQTGGLATRVRALGGSVIEVPVMAVADPTDGGAALAAALASAPSPDWLVVTSPNGAQRLAQAIDQLDRDRPEERSPGRPKLAVVGPGTAEECTRLGLRVDLVPARFVAEGLLDAFPAGRGRVVVAQAAAARSVLADGLRAKGWTVDAVVAYRTVASPVDPGLVERAAAADAIAFTSGSSVRCYLAAAGPAGMPATVVCIGPVTAEAVVAAGLEPNAVAREHSLDGLVAALVEALA